MFCFVDVGAKCIFTVNMSVLMLGGSRSLVTDSINTKKAMTMRKSPLMNPERISTRPNLASIKFNKM